MFSPGRAVLVMLVMLAVVFTFRLNQVFGNDIALRSFERNVTRFGGRWHHQQDEVLGLLFKVALVHDGIVPRKLNGSYPIQVAAEKTQRVAVLGAGMTKA